MGVLVFFLASKSRASVRMMRTVSNLTTHHILVWFRKLVVGSVGFSAYICSLPIKDLVDSD